MNDRMVVRFTFALLCGASSAPLVQAQGIVDACEAPGGCAETKSFLVSMQVPDFDPYEAERYWFLLANFGGTTRGGTHDADRVEPDRGGLIARQGFTLPGEHADVSPYQHYFLVRVDKQTGDMRFTLDLLDAPLFWFAGALNDALAEAERLMLEQRSGRPLDRSALRAMVGPGAGIHAPAVRRDGVRFSLSSENLDGVELIAQLRELTSCEFSMNEDGFLAVTSCPVQ